MENESMQRETRILHVGNVFLDRPIARVRQGAPERRREELRDSFSRLMSEVEERGVRLVLFSGNLIDNRYATNDTVEFLVRAFSAQPACHFVIAPGPYDCFSDTSIYRSGRFPRNVHIFTEEVLSRFDFDELGLTVYGWAFNGEMHHFSPVAHKHVASAEQLNILCGCCELDEEGSTLCPVSSADIAHFGAHYAGLGGDTPYEGFLRVENAVYSYGGHFESTSFADRSAGGASLITATPFEDGAWQLSTKRIPTGSYRYVEETVDVSHLSRNADAAERILERIAERGYGEKTVLRVFLRGSVPAEAAFVSLDTAADYGVYALQVSDQTVPTDGTEYLLRDMSAKGELYRHLYAAMTEGTPEACAHAARIFRIGYAALCQKDFTKH